MRVTLGDWCGTRSGGYDTERVQWTINPVDGVQGWDDGPPMRTKFDERPQAPGVFDAQGYADARVVVVEGTISVDREDDLPALYAARRRTQALLADGSLGLLVIEDGDEATQAEVRLSDKPTCDVDTWHSYTFSLQFTAPDPVRYETAQRQGQAAIFTDPSGGLRFPLRFPLRFSTGAGGNDGRIVVDNPGTAATWPIITLYGPDAGLVQQQPVVTAPDGGSLAYRDSLSRGEFLEIDTWARTVMLQGQSSRRYRMSSAEFDSFRVPPGSALPITYSTSDYPNGGSYMTARWRPGWW